ncbi:hypothetical protein ACMYYO_06235 [Dermacoccaceae bacterium W4C1]
MPGRESQQTFELLEQRYPGLNGAISDAGNVGYTTVGFDTTPAAVTSDTRTAVEKTIEQARAAGLRVNAGGNAIEASGRRTRVASRG